MVMHAWVDDRSSDALVRPHEAVGEWLDLEIALWALASLQRFASWPMPALLQGRDLPALGYLWPLGWKSD